MADETTGLGQLITRDVVGRDAVHVAIAPATAGQTLYPGQHVKMQDGRAVGAGTEAIGCVDPYLLGPVYPDQRFWLFLRPGSITSLRHEWTHPAFDGEPPPPLSPEKERARVAIQALAEHLGLTFDRVITEARSYKHSGDMHVDWSYESKDMPDDFWDHYEVWTGETVEESRRDRFFTCAGCSR